jgi:hypothetical protein
MNSFKIIDWRSVTNNSLRGFARVELPSGMLIADVVVMIGTNGPWASPPSKPMIGRDGVALADDKGKVKYQPIIEFRTKDLRDRFSSAVIEALRSAHPEALT